MKIISWNVNGIRAAIKKGFADFMEEHQPDILLLQEVKAERDQVELPFSEDDWEVHWNHADKKGYSGVAAFSRPGAKSVELGLDIEGNPRPRWHSCAYS